MKLTNQQINALAKDIYKRSKEYREALRETLLSEYSLSQEEKVKFAKIKKAVESVMSTELVSNVCFVMPNKARHYLSTYELADLKKNYIQNKVFEDNKEKLVIPLESEISNEIILATIDCENLDGLLKYLNSKFIQ